MAQVSYGTITINDITDISDVYLIYAVALSTANENDIINDNYAFDSLGERGWNNTYAQEYPTWQPGYQIWIREVQEKEGVQQKEYKTPYLDTAVNQINNNYINLQSKIKKMWSNATGSYMASGINNNDVDEDDVSTYGYNSKITTTGISFNYNTIPLIEMGILNSGNFSGIKLYSPILTGSIITNSRLDATLTSEGLKLLKGGIDAGEYSSTTTNFIYLSTEDYNRSPVITIGNNSSGWRQIIGSKFGVKNDGTLYASNADIEGTINASSGSFSGTITTSNITATGGTIGGWNIGSAFLSTSTTGTPGSGIITLSKSIAGPTSATGVLPASQTWAFTASNQFGVTTAGKLYSTGAVITGAITATSFTAQDSTGKTRAAVNTNGLIVYDTDGSTQVASFGASARIGKVADTNIYIATAGTDAGFKLNVKNSAGTNSVTLANIGFDNSQGYETDKNFPKGLWYTFGDRGGTAAQRGYYSFVNGFNNLATHNASVAFGIHNSVYGPCAMSIGLHNSIGDSSKTSINSYSTANLSGTGSLAVGYGLQATGLYQIVAGCYNTPVSDAYLVIGNGNGSSTSSRSNSLVVSQTGTITMNNGQYLRLNSGAGSSYSWNQIWSGSADGGDGGVTSNLYLQADGYIGFYVGTASTAPTGRMYVHYGGTSVSGTLSCGSTFTAGGVIVAGSNIRLPNGISLTGARSNGENRALCYVSSDNNLIYGSGSYSNTEDKSTSYFEGYKVIIRSNGGGITISGGINTTGTLTTGGKLTVPSGGAAITGAVTLTGAVTTSTTFTGGGVVYSTGNTMCVSDNAQWCGNSSHRWKGVYAVDSTINTSDRKDKDILGSIDFAKNLIMSLEPIQYMWKAGDHRRKRLGFIAQDVAQICKKLNENLSLVTASYGHEGEENEQLYLGEPVDDNLLKWGMSYEQLIAPMVQVIQDQQKEIEQLKKEVAQLK